MRLLLLQLIIKSHLGPHTDLEDVCLLNGQQVVLDQRQVPGASEHVDDARVVQPRLQHVEQVHQQLGVLVQVELEGLHTRLYMTL